MLPTKSTPYLRTSCGLPALCIYSTAEREGVHARLMPTPACVVCVFEYTSKTTQ